jgi:hypothetical protein
MLRNEASLFSVMLRNEASPQYIYLPQRHRVHREKRKRFKIGACFQK